MTQEKDVLTTGEVAKICNVAPRTVSKWFDSGQLQGYRIPGSRDRRIPVSGLMRFMSQHNIPMDGLKSGKTRVLIVDGDASVRDAVKKLLVEQANYEVHTADTGFSAGLECEKFRPHVLLLDMHLGDAQGQQVADNIRRCADLEVTRIVAMSGKLTDGQLQHLLHSGFDGTLKKPFSARQVIQSIEDATAIVY